MAYSIRAYQSKLKLNICRSTKENEKSKENHEKIKKKSEFRA